MRLPREIRDEIYYYYAFGSESIDEVGIIGVSLTRGSYPTLGPEKDIRRLLRVNTIIHDEANAFVYSHFIFAWPTNLMRQYAHSLVRQSLSPWACEMMRNVELCVDCLHGEKVELSLLRNQIKRGFKVLVYFLPNLKKVILVARFEPDEFVELALDIASPFKCLAPGAVRFVASPACFKTKLQEVNERMRAGTW